MYNVLQPQRCVIILVGLSTLKDKPLSYTSLRISQHFILQMLCAWEYI